MYVEFKKINKLDIEITTKCNAKCPMCTRYKNGDTSQPKPGLPLHDMPLDAFKKTITKESCKGIQLITFCGKYGDPLMHPDLLSFVKHIKSISNNTSINIHTNASLRSEKFWAELGTMMNLERGDIVRFSIDGLEDTNHIYRQNTNWKTIMRNAKTYIENGGVANWDYLIFAHNEHRVEEDKSLARTMGFKTFSAKQSRRIITKSLQARTNKTGTVIAVKPSADHAVNKSDNREIFNVKGATGMCHQSIEIECPGKENGDLFMSADGTVWPCCFLPPDFPHNVNTKRIFERYGKTFNSIHHFSLKEILNNDYFAKDLEASWEKKDITLATTCVKNCKKQTAQRQ